MKTFTKIFGCTFLFSTFIASHFNAALVCKEPVDLKQSLLLKCAINEGNLQNVQEMIEANGSLLNTPLSPETGTTPLMYASARGNAIMVEDFLARNASLFEVDCYGQNVLHYLMQIEHASPRIKSFEQNIRNRLIILNLILFRNQKNWGLVAQTNIAGQTPLHYACHYSLMSLVEALLPYASPQTINLPDKNLLTPLHIAVALGHAGIIKLLITHHATCDPLTTQKILMNHDIELFDYIIKSMTWNSRAIHKKKK